MSSTQCPHCQVHLKLPEEKLHSKVKCPKCGSAFLAKPAAAAGHEPTKRQRKRPTKKKTNPTPYVVLVVALAITIGAWALIQGGADEGGGGKEQSANSTKPAGTTGPAEATVDPFDHPATRPARQLQSALTSYNDNQLRSLLDLRTWFEREQPDGRKWTSVLGADQSRYGQELAKRLLEEPELRRYAERKLVRASFAGSVYDTAEVTLRSEDQPEMLWKFQTAQVDGIWKIRSYAFEVEKPAEEVDEDAKKKPATGFVETQGGGLQMRGVIEAVDLVEGTTEEEAAAMREMFLLAMAESGLESKTAKRDLIKKGHPAIPVLLNEFVARPLDGTKERSEEAAIIHGMLQDISFRQISFPMRDLNPDKPAILLEKQQQAVEAWFGWWKAWGKRWDAWVEKSGAPAPEPEKPGRTRR